MVRSGSVSIGDGAAEAIVQASRSAAANSAIVASQAAERIAQSSVGSGSGGNHPDAVQWARRVASRLAETGCSRAVCLLGAQAFVEAALEPAPAPPPRMAAVTDAQSSTSPDAIGAYAAEGTVAPQDDGAPPPFYPSAARAAAASPRSPVEAVAEGAAEGAEEGEGAEAGAGAVASAAVAAAAAGPSDAGHEEEGEAGRELAALALDAALTALVEELRGRSLESRPSATPEQLRDEMRILDGLRASAAASTARALAMARPAIRRAAAIAQGNGCAPPAVQATVRAVALLVGAAMRAKGDGAAGGGGGKGGGRAGGGGGALALDVAAKAASQASLAGHTPEEAAVAAAAAAEAMAPGNTAGALVAGAHAAKAMARGALKVEAMAAGAAAAQERTEEEDEATEESVDAAARAAARTAAAVLGGASGRVRSESAHRLVGWSAAAAAAAVRDGHSELEAVAAAKAVCDAGVDAAASASAAQRLADLGAQAARSLRDRLAHTSAIARATLGVRELSDTAIRAAAQALQRGESPGLAAVACISGSVSEVAAAAATAAMAAMAAMAGHPPEASAAAAAVAARALSEEASPSVAIEAASSAATTVAEVLTQSSAAKDDGSGATDPGSAVASLAARLEGAVAEGVSRGAATIAELEGPLSMPSWSLESWLSSLNLDTILCDALLKRVRERTGGATDPRQELAFVTQLGKAPSSPSVVEALLDEAGVASALSQVIFDSAHGLHSEVKEAKEAEAKRRAAERERKRKALRARRRLKAAGAAARMAGGVLSSRILAQLRDDAPGGKGGEGGEGGEGDVHGNGEASGAEGGGEEGAPGGSASEPAVLTAEQLNSQFAEGGAITLYYSNDNELFWQGLNRVVGKGCDGIEESVFDVMKREHCESVDSDSNFEASNHQITTTSKIEWWFVADPANGLSELGLERWPPHRWDWERRADPKEKWAEYIEKSINAPLAAQGEKLVTDEEFIALRLYTGPLFVKYNGLLRGSVSTVPFLISMCKTLCMGNSYPTTIHTLSAAIIKLSKLQSACTLYRAPGGALPKSFWRAPRGGIEPAFMSTTTNREEAMHYARRSPSKILFEVQQGMVARGASVAWLSQYPTEEEILFPPLTVLEVVRMRVDGTVIVAEVSPSVPKPNAAPGDEDAVKAHEEKLKLVGEAQQAMAEAQEAQARAMELRHQAERAKWQQSMMSMMKGAREAQAASMRIAAEEAKASARLSDAEKEEKMRLLAEKEAAFEKASKEAQAVVDATNAEQAQLQGKIAREQAAMVENMKRNRLKRQATTLSNNFSVRMLHKKASLDVARAAREAAERASKSAGSAADEAAAQAYAKAQVEFEEAARQAAEEAEATIVDLRDKCKPIILREEIGESIARMPTSELISRLKTYVTTRNVEGTEVAVEAVLKRVKEEPPKPGMLGKTNARLDVPEADGLQALVSCIGFAVDRARTPVAKGGGPAGKLLDDLCKALGYLLEQEGNEAKAVEAGVLEAIAKAIDQQMSAGLKTVKTLTKDEAMRAKAVKAGIRKEWIKGGEGGE